MPKRVFYVLMFRRTSPLSLNLSLVDVSYRHLAEFERLTASQPSCFGRFFFSIVAINIWSISSRMERFGPT